jgi:hypothetical protein
MCHAIDLLKVNLEYKFHIGYNLCVTLFIS